MSEETESDRPEPAEVEQSDRSTQPLDQEAPPRLPFPVVGIGASAGGLEAFGELFSAMPIDTGMAFVLIQHLPPDRESMIAEILSRQTKMPVAQVSDMLAVEPNHVYVIRPGHTLRLKDGLLHLGARLEKPGNNRPVDDFFKSLADEQRERAIAIIMSGMGSNGTAGAQAVKAVGGLCIAQDPDTAHFPSMPRHLIESGYADYVLRTAEMPDALIRYIKHPYLKGGRQADALVRPDSQYLREILAILRTRTRQDFAGYKKPTVLRRIQRRMGLNHMTALSDYTRVLRQNTTEAIALADDLLIHVTGFFRDTEAWESLRTQVIVPLIAERDLSSDIRCWVTACSSGEEAYTLAILLLEECERVKKPLDIKVFATDTAERTLANARGGTYPGGIEAEITPQRLERFFQKEDAVYRVRQDLRQAVVFAPQNILQDPPFSRLDIATCRNLLIYLEPSVQSRILAMLHFGLREGGVLYLGASETVSGAEDLFEVIDKKSRIFRRVGPPRRPVGEIPVPRSLYDTNPVHRFENTPPPKPSMAQLTNAALLARHVPAAVTIDRDYRIVYFHGNTAPFLDLPTGEPTRDLLAMCRESVRGAVRSALGRAIKTASTAAVVDGWVGEGPERRRIIVAASPLDAKAVPDFYVISFDVHFDPLLSGPASDEGSRHLEGDLQRVRDELQSTIEELQSSNEEHRASAEEVMSMNEELQSTNEELETSREEMQSLNEELTTVNAQLHAKVDESQAMSSDLTSLLSSTDIAVLFLDRQLRIRRFTPAVKDLLELIDTDIGRPLSDLNWKFTDPDFLPEAGGVLDRLVPREREISAASGKWYFRRILPYRTGDNRIDGLVITFVDISERIRMEASLAERARLLDLSNDVIVVRNRQNRIVYWNSGATDLYGWNSDEALGKDVDLLLKTQAPRSLEQLIEELRHCERVTGEVVQYARDGRSITTLCRWALDRDPAGAPRLILTTAIDITERKKAEDAVRESEEQFRQLLVDAKQNAEKANRMKDEFLTTLSHELRTPLSAILLWTKMLQADPVSPDRMAEGLAAIKSSADAQTELIDDLLDTSRIISGKLRLQLREVEFKPLIDGAVEGILPAAQAKGIEVTREIGPNVGRVVIDADRIRQVVWNLLANAVKFTPAGGKVEVTVSRRDKIIEIRVSDNGRGIDAEFLSNVFDRFRQADASSTCRHGGLGLGLDISKQLVELHGGTIDAQSEGLDRGATFIVRLPLKLSRTAEAPSSTEEHLPPPRAALKGRKILLVEDEPKTRNALMILLNETGAHTAAVATAAAALDAYEKSRPDLIVSDIGLPEHDGYYLIQHIRQKEAAINAPEIPAIALTAFAREEDRDRALHAGFQKHMEKPVDPERLIAAVATMLKSVP